MEQKVCSNPDCNKTYSLADNDADSETCSFPCWEKMHCMTPPEVIFEKLELA
jgi:hypothetical protein